MARREEDYFSAAARFDRRSLVPWVHPTLTRAEGIELSFTSRWSRREQSLLDFSQNAGCVIFGHNAPAALGALEGVIEARTPLRLPLANCLAEEALRARLKQLAHAELAGGDGGDGAAGAEGAAGANGSSDGVGRTGSGSGGECVYECILGMHSGAEAFDLALSLALFAPRIPAGAPHLDYLDSHGRNRKGRNKSHECDDRGDAVAVAPERLYLVLLEGSFHGNCTRSAFSASAVFRSQAARGGWAGGLVDYDVVSISPDASAAEIGCAFAMHDHGEARCLAVAVEALQHHSRLVPLNPATAVALAREARARGVKLICDEIWSGVFRTGGFFGCRKVLKPDLLVLSKGLSAGLLKHAAVLVHKSLLIGDGDGAVRGRTGRAGGGAMLEGRQPARARRREQQMVQCTPVVSAPPRPAEACALCCAAALACIEAVDPHAIAERAAAIAKRLDAEPLCVAPRAETPARAEVSYLDEQPRGSLKKSLKGTSLLLPVRGLGYSYEFEFGSTAPLPGWAATLVNALSMLHMLWVGRVLLLLRPLRAPRRFHAELGLETSDAQLAALVAAVSAAAAFAERLTRWLCPALWLVRLVARRRVTPAAATPTVTTADAVTTAAAVDTTTAAGDTNAAAAAAAAPLPPLLPSSWERECEHRALLAAVDALPTFAHASGAHLELSSGGLDLPPPSPPPLRPPPPHPLPSARAILDCCAGRAASVLGHHHPSIATAARAFLSAKAPVYFFGLLAMKPTAQALCGALEALAHAPTTESPAAEDAPRSGDRQRRRRWRARLMNSSVDALEAALRLSLLRWHARGDRGRVESRPIILLLGDEASRGASWMLRGLPTSASEVHVLPRAVLRSEKALRAALAPYLVPGLSGGENGRDRHHSLASLPPADGASDGAAFAWRPVNSCATSLCALLIEPVCSQTGAGKSLTPQFPHTSHRIFPIYHRILLLNFTRSALGGGGAAAATCVRRAACATRQRRDALRPRPLRRPPLWVRRSAVCRRGRLRRISRGRLHVGGECHLRHARLWERQLSQHRHSGER